MKTLNYLLNALIYTIFFLTSILSSAQASKIEKLKFINFSPYVVSGQNPNIRSKIPESQIASLLDSIKRYTEGIRTFGTTDGLDRIPYRAKAINLKVIMGIWLSSDTTVNNEQLAAGIKIANDGMADRIIVGSEVLLRRELTVNKIIEYINKIKKACPGIPVSCADVTANIINNPTLIEACDFVSVNIYPYWEHMSINCAIKSFHQSYLAVKSIAKGKEVFISESGWKTEGYPLGDAIPSLENAIRYNRELMNWQKATGNIVNLFSAFDEPWKLPNDGGWGIMNNSAILKTGMEKVFEPIVTVDTTWLCNKIENSEKDTLSLDFIPVRGSYHTIDGHVNHINPCEYKIAAYIMVPNWGWVVKPTYANPSVPISCTGKWSINYVTGGTDYNASDICLFVIPSGYTPPLVGGGSSIPNEIYEKALSWKCIHRDSIKTASLISSADTICLGSSLTLKATGGTKYLWSTGDTSSVIKVKPSIGATYTYTVEISDGNGMGQVLTKNILVIDGFLAVEPNYSEICRGDSLKLSLHEWSYDFYSNFEWNTGQTADSIIIAPATSSEYFVTGTTREGCRKTVSCYVTVNQCETKFKLNFNRGWNIFSINNTPRNPDMKSIFLPLINRGSLLKIQDELGKSLDESGIFGSWKNNIGNNHPAEGYKIKVMADDSLEVFGFPVEFPYAIPLKKGWNIAGYPQTTGYNGKKIIQQLIDRGTLVKVQDERGNSIEDWGIFGSWQNNIGDFEPGEGYKIKLESPDTLWIYKSYQKSTHIQPEQVATTYFQLAFEGNGVDHMNFNLVELPTNILQIGDELAIFDGTICVGAVTLMPHHFITQNVSVTASATDDLAMTGFAEGNPITLKLWKQSSKKESVLATQIVKGTSSFTKHETIVARLDTSTATGLQVNMNLNDPEINCYPNPFNDEITFEIKLKTDAEVSVEVLNQTGQLVNTIVTKKQYESGIHQLIWNGKNANNREVSSGIYYFQIKIDGFNTHKKIVYSK